MLIKLFSYLKTLNQKRNQSQPLTPLDIALFLRQFATLITAGVPLLKCCELLQHSQIKHRFVLFIYHLKQTLLQGHSLSTCLMRYPEYFDDFSQKLIHLSEKTGQLDSMLTLVANYHEKKWLFQKKIKQILFYPCCIMVTAILVILFMLIFIVPKFSNLFQSSQIELPILTKIIFYLSNILLNKYYILLIILIFIILFLYYLFKIKNIKIICYFKKLPLIRHYNYQAALLQLTRNLALTFKAGLPITESITLAANTTSHSLFIHHAQKIKQQLNAGVLLHQALTDCHYFPALLIQMIKMGEESGMLESMLTKASDFFDADLNELHLRLETLLEPLIMVGLGVLIGGLVIGMYLPIFKLGSTL